MKFSRATSNMELDWEGKGLEIFLRFRRVGFYFTSEIVDNTKWIERGHYQTSSRRLARQ